MSAAAITQFENWIYTLAGKNKLAIPQVLGKLQSAGHSLLADRQPGVAQQQMAELIRQLRSLLNDDFLGMARQATPYGSAEVVIKSALTGSSLGEFLLAMIPASELIYFANDIHGAVETDQGMCRLRMQLSDQPEQAAVFSSYGLMAMHRGLCWLTGRYIRLQRVEFGDSNPALLNDGKVIFNCPVTLGGNETAITFSAHYLQAPITRQRTEIDSYLKQRPLDILYIPGSDLSISESTRHCALRFLEQQQRLPSFAELADALHLSEALLQKKLAEEGSGWLTIRNQLRQSRAEYLLIHTTQTIETIAEQLGFNEVNSFFRAFRRWTGQSPRQYRQSKHD